MGNRLYLETRNPALIRETFTANEENRAASLRTLLQGAANDRSTSQFLPDLLNATGRRWRDYSAPKWPLYAMAPAPIWRLPALNWSASKPPLVAPAAFAARAWRGRSVLLRGRDATREKLFEALLQGPAVVHLAAHYLESAGPHRYGLLALSLSPAGDSQVLTSFEISCRRIRAGLVVVSGCHSAAGAPLPGEGALGMPRAWLAARAESVVGSLWDTPDDDGPLFAELYRNLRALGRLGAGQALRQAQLSMLRSGGRFGRPAYWGSYFVLANRGMGELPR